MSPQHDWLNLGSSSEANEERDPADPTLESDADASGAAERAEGAPAGSDIDRSEGDGSGGVPAEGTDQPDRADQPEQTEAPADAEPTAEAAEAGESAEAGPTGAGPTGAGQTDAGQTDAEQTDAEQTDAMSSGQDQRWSGRAVGPLSRLLPGGSVELNGDEVPGERPSANLTAADPSPATSAVGGHEPPSAVVPVDLPSASAPAAAEPEPALAVGAAELAPESAESGSERGSGVAESGSAQEAEVAEPELATATPDDGETVAALGPGDALAGEDSSAAQVAEAVEPADMPADGLTATDDRWHAALVGFVDDPRGSVEAARVLIDEDIATHISLLARHKEAMHAAWQAGDAADTEALRVALVNYRDLRKRLVDVVTLLTD